MDVAGRRLPKTLYQGVRADVVGGALPGVQVVGGRQAKLHVRGQLARPALVAEGYGELGKPVPVTRAKVVREAGIEDEAPVAVVLAAPPQVVSIVAVTGNGQAHSRTQVESGC